MEGRYPTTGTPSGGWISTLRAVGRVRDTIWLTSRRAWDLSLLFVVSIDHGAQGRRRIEWMRRTFHLVQQRVDPVEYDAQLHLRRVVDHHLVQLGVRPVTQRHAFR
jgi:hypothetical protein